MSTTSKKVESLGRNITKRYGPPTEGSKWEASIPIQAANGQTEARGKFFYTGDEKIVVRGPTYGAFAPNDKKEEYWCHEKIRNDFRMMAEYGFNAVRIPHTMPPKSLLDTAQYYGLKVMVGLSAEQYVGYLADPHKRAPNIRRIIQEKIKPVAGHPAILCYALGNEIPATMARWIGKRKVERYLENLYNAVKEISPESIVTYVNYPSTEYLELPFLDAVAFNVYLESQDQLEAYLARLHSIAGDRPLLMSELGLDAMRNGEEKQAEVLTWQLQTVQRAGCAGSFIFSWTDEWYRAGQQVDDWEFGLTDIERRPKAALKAVAKVMEADVFPKDTVWPKISVVVCSYNGSKTIRKTLEELKQLDYPNFEVIVINDGSTDATPEIAAKYNVRLVTQKNTGLSGARNTGASLANGEIVAYIDDDAYPDRDWLRFLAWTYLTTDYAAVGGPNVTPREDRLVSQAVAHAPGGAIHVLIGDTEAEHIPGCNMSFRKKTLEIIGGFDTRFRAAGDDVDVCWKIAKKDMKIGFNPAAMVWHHRRSSINAYWQQQYGYGKAEALLEQKWPEKYNAIGHISWASGIYGNNVLRSQSGNMKERVYQGVWGLAPFQSLYQRPKSVGGYLPTMPEWYLITSMLLTMGIVGFSWEPIRILTLLGILGVGLSCINACKRGFSIRLNSLKAPERFKMKLLVSMLTALQPAARLTGRMKEGLMPWNRCRSTEFMLPYKRQYGVWCETWLEPAKRILHCEEALKAQRLVVKRGGDFDRWDLEVRGGLLGSARVLFAVEDHGAGTQYVRYQIRGVWHRSLIICITTILAIVFLAIIENQNGAALMLISFVYTSISIMVIETGRAMKSILNALESQDAKGISNNDENIDKEI